MKRKLVMAMLSLAVASAAFATPTTVQAAGLTQAADASQVVYSRVNENDIPLIEGLFDFEYYKQQNPDLVEVLGDDYTALFNHFIRCGIFEGRTCNANFDPSAYASAYSDLKDAFGTDIVSYYKHYVLIGTGENRNLTTVEACANAGISVESLADNSVKITPQGYMIAKALGYTWNYNAIMSVQSAVNEAVSSGSTSTVLAGPSGNVVLTLQGDEKAMELCKDLDLICEIPAAEGVNPNGPNAVWIY